MKKETSGNLILNYTEDTEKTLRTQRETEKDTEVLRDTDEHREDLRAQRL